MSSPRETFQTGAQAKSKFHWSLWRRQVAAIMRLELKKNFFGKRSILVYLLAMLPIFLLTMLALFAPWSRDFQGRTADAINGSFNNLSRVFAWIYGGLILRTVVFFGCAWIFMNLFRGELVDRSLHYYFLSSVRREVLVFGKYLSGLVTSTVLFVAVTIVSMLLLFFPHFPAESARFFLDGAGMGQLLTYAGITVLACIGYGAFFLVVGLFFRNPIIPALVLYGWEAINFLLPPLLKKISVIHYLNSLTPVPAPESTPFAVMVEPTSAWLSVPGLLIVTSLVLIGAGIKIRHMEIKYGSD